MLGKYKALLGKLPSNALTFTLSPKGFQSNMITVILYGGNHNAGF